MSSLLIKCARSLEVDRFCALNLAVSALYLYGGCLIIPNGSFCPPYEACVVILGKIVCTLKNNYSEYGAGELLAG